MGSLAPDIRRDHVADTTVVRIAGSLDLTAASELREVLTTCLAELPAAVVVDLSAVVRIDPLALSIVSARASAQRRTGPAVSLVLCGGHPMLSTRRARVMFGRDVSVASSLAEGLRLAGIARLRISRVAEEFWRGDGAPEHARQLVARACAAWQVEHVVANAELIASELTTNAVVHARSRGSIEVLLRDPYLHIRVTDSDPLPPARPPPDGVAPDREGGRGLWLVHLVSSGWGWVPRQDGKTVWATLRVRQVDG